MPLSIGQVTTTLTLVAFIVAAALAAYRYTLRHKENILEKADSEKAKTIALSVLDAVGVDVSTLSNKQKFELAKETLNLRSKKLLYSTIATVVIALLAAGVSGIGLYSPHSSVTQGTDGRNDSSSNSSEDTHSALAVLVKSSDATLVSLREIDQKLTENSSEFLERQERKKIKSIILGLTRSEAGNGMVSNSLERYIENPNKANWQGIRLNINEIAHIRKVLLDNVNTFDGDLIFKDIEIYRDLSSLVTSRSNLYSQLETMELPKSDTELAQLSRINGNFKAIILEAENVARRLSEYLNTTKQQNFIFRDSSDITVDISDKTFDLNVLPNAKLIAQSSGRNILGISAKYLSSKKLLIRLPDALAGGTYAIHVDVTYLSGEKDRISLLETYGKVPI